MLFSSTGCTNLANQKCKISLKGQTFFNSLKSIFWEIYSGELFWLTVLFNWHTTWIVCLIICFRGQSLGKNIYIKNFLAPFYALFIPSRLESLSGGSLLFTTKFTETPGTQFIDLGRMKGWVDLGVTQCLEH